MKLKTIFILNAVIFGLTTINFLFLTPLILRFYSPVPDYVPGIDIIWTGRVLATCFAIIALLSWWVRDAGPSPVRAAIVKSFAVGYMLNAIVHVLAILNGSMNRWGWAVVALTGLFAAGFWLRRDDC